MESGCIADCDDDTLAVEGKSGGDHVLNQFATSDSNATMGQLLTIAHKARWSIRRWVPTALAVLGICAVSVPVASQTRAPFRIRADSAACLLSNSARYLPAHERPFYLYLDLCPNVQPAKDQIATLNSNIDIKERKVGSGPPLRGIVRVNKKDLKCLLNQIRKQQAKGALKGHLLINLAEC